MKPLYNSTKGRTARPRIAVREIGIMPAHLKKELSKMDKFQAASFKICAGMGLINLGIDVLNLYRHG